MDPNGARPSPFDEDSNAATLRRIAEATRAIDETRTEMEAAKEDYAAARGAHRAAVSLRDKLISEELKGYPLFPKAASRPALPEPAPPALPAPEGAPDAPPADAPAADVDPLRSMWLSNLGLGDAIVIALGAAGVQSLGQLEDYIAGRIDLGGTGDPLPGLDLDQTAAVLEAVAKARAPKPDPDAKPKGKGKGKGKKGKGDAEIAPEKSASDAQDAQDKPQDPASGDQPADAA